MANSHDTRFQLASVSKQFTAAAIMLLADRAALSVQDPVLSWLGRCPPSWESMTIHHLLVHTSGIGHWDDMPQIDGTAAMEPARELAIVQGRALRSEPGAQWHYSSPGYFLLAHIVQRAAARPYATFLAEEIFGPLGMTATFAGNAGGRDRVATGYSHGQPVTPYELELTNMGAGDVWSTTGDVAKWDAALAARSLLSETSWQAMLARHAAIDDLAEGASPVRTDGYGYGWFTGSVSGLPVRYHPGDNPGFHALNGWIPDLAARVIIMSNEQAASIPELAGEILASVLAS